MFFLAGLLGIMAAGTAAIMTFDFGDNAEDSDAAEGNATSGVEGETPTDEGDMALFDDLLADDSGDPEAAPEDEENAEDQIITGSETDEAISGGTGDDQINGYDGDDTLAGGTGADHLYGDDGDDSLAGEAGDDLLHGETGTDSMTGGSGDDTLFGHSGDDLLEGGDGADSLIGGFGADLLDGGDGDDSLLGREGDDTLNGGAGQDVLFGGDGNDLVDGTGDEGAADFLNGGDGDDMIRIGAGDIATGGDGMDSFFLAQWQDAEAEATIMDFDREEDSLILLYEDMGGADPEVEVRTDAETPGTGAIYVNGFHVATVQGGGDLSPAEITLLPQGSPGAAELVRL